MSKVIGISGKAGHGKDAVAVILQQNLHGVTPILKFAQPLRDILCTLLDCSDEDIEQDNFKSTPIEWLGGITPRQIMIAIGDALRGLNEDFFLLYIKKQIDDLVEFQTGIISDCRFKNEANFIKGIGGHLVRVNRKIGLPSSDHQSEIELDDYTGFDFVIENDSDLDSLMGKVKNLSEKLK